MLDSSGIYSYECRLAGDRCPLLAHLLGVVPQGGLEEFAAVPDVEQLGADVDVNGAPGAMAADGDLLPRDADASAGRSWAR